MKGGGSSFAWRTEGSNQEASKPSEAGASATGPAGLLPSNSTAPLFSSAEDVTVLLTSFTSGLAGEMVAAATVDNVLDFSLMPSGDRLASGTVAPLSCLANDEFNFAQ